MLHSRIPAMGKMPLPVREAFLEELAGSSDEVVMYREACARVVLDSLGYTGLNKATHHNAVVSDARNWFKHDRSPDYDSSHLFDLAEMSRYPTVRAAVLATAAIYLDDDVEIPATPDDGD